MAKTPTNLTAHSGAFEASRIAVMTAQSAAANMARAVLNQNQSEPLLLRPAMVAQLVTNGSAISARCTYARKYAAEMTRVTTPKSSAGKRRAKPTISKNRQSASAPWSTIAATPAELKCACFSKATLDHPLNGSYVL